MTIDGLTPQQHRVALLVSEGLTDKQIATLLRISSDGVSFHIRRIAERWQLTGNLRVAIANHMRDAAA